MTQISIEHGLDARGILKELESRRSRRLVAILAVATLCLGFRSKADAQTASVSIRAVDGKASVSWPAGLNLVQPEFITDLSTGKWQELGAPTEASSLLETIAPGQAFYRLRFLAPKIQTQPAGQSLAAGGNVALTVAATGTAPLTYQWLKDGEKVIGQTGTSFPLNTIGIGDAAGYSVVVANSVGSVTSLVAVLTVNNAVPATPPQGIYLGNFAGQTNGGFAALIRTNGPGILLALNTTLIEGLFSTNLVLAADGGFAMLGEKGAKVSGKIGSETLEGTITGTNGVAGAFNAALKPATGLHQADAGFYVGTFGGFLTGNAFVILAADGAAVTYLTSPTAGVVSTSAIIDASNKFASTAAYTLPGTTIPAPIQIAGTLDPAAHVFSGSYSLNGIPLGTFSLTRSVSP